MSLPGFCISPITVGWLKKRELSHEGHPYVKWKYCKRNTQRKIRRSQRKGGKPGESCAKRGKRVEVREEKISTASNASKKSSKTSEKRSYLQYVGTDSMREQGQGYIAREK